jgi:ADP-heptose:LPS heptosyltransferase
MLVKEISAKQRKKSWLGKFFLNTTRRAWEINATGFTPSDQRRFLAQEVTRPRRVLKFLKRRFIMWVLGQDHLEVNRIALTAKRILWISLSAPSIGDSIMDLAAARLLAGRSLHLLTGELNAPLHSACETFEAVFTSVEATLVASKQDPYDFVIVDSYTPRSLLPKYRIAKDVPFVGLYGYLNGYEMHRTLFAFNRMQTLLGVSTNTKLRVSPELKLKPEFRMNTKIPNNLRTCVCVAVGAEWEFRRYAHWGAVIDEIGPGHNFILIGSKNGLRDAERIESRCQSVTNYVGKITLVETARLISECDFILAADGGLWHIGCAFGKPSVSLFADCQLFDQAGRKISRMTPDIPSIDLMAETSVSEIPPWKIVRAFRLLQKRHESGGCNAEN